MSYDTLGSPQISSNPSVYDSAVQRANLVVNFTEDACEEKSVPVPLAANSLEFPLHPHHSRLRTKEQKREETKEKIFSQHHEEGKR